MRTTLRRVIFKLKESLFTVPIVILAVCVAAAGVALWVDSRFADTIEGWPVVVGATVAGGRAIATTVAGATITVAAIVFSITALSTQMAANQYSPRALGGFFEDTLQQVIIGLVVGTFTYSLLVLGSLSNAIVDASGPSPSVSVTISILLGVMSAIGIVAYINHSLRQMQVDSVVRRIAAGSIRAIEKNLRREGEGEVPYGDLPGGTPTAVKATRGGWVIQIDIKDVLEAMPVGASARIDVRLGEAVSRGDTVATIWLDPETEWDPGPLRGAVVTAGERSLDLDPTFGIRQLVDIALRALSPGVNDPTTAVDVVQHLKTPVRTVLLSEPPRRVISDDRDRRVFLAETPSRSDYVHMAFSEIRLAAKGQPFVLGALIEVLEDLLGDVSESGFESRAGAVREELELTVAAAHASGFPDPDLKRVLEKGKD